MQPVVNKKNYSHLHLFPGSLMLNKKGWEVGR